MSFFLTLCLFTIYHSSQLDTLYSLYKKGEYKRIIELTEKPDTFGMKREEKARIFLFRGIAFIAFREFERAKNSFKICLNFDPSLELNEKEYSPLILKTFYEVKRNIEAKKTEIKESPVLSPLKTPEKEKVKFHKPTFPDIIIPGLYTLKYGRKIKGYLMLSGFLISAFSLVYSDYKFNYYYKKYMSSRKTQEIDYYYKKSEFYYRMKISFSVSLTFFFLWNFYEITR